MHVHTENKQFLWSDACKAKRVIVTASCLFVLLFVRPSTGLQVTLTYRGHTD